MRSLLLIFLSHISLLFSIEIPKELKILEKKTFSDPELNTYLKEFSYRDYLICSVNGLGKFYIDDIPDGIKWHLRQGIYWEHGIAQLVLKYTKTGTIALDLGAHIGIHTIAMARQVGRKGKVIAFEPQYKMFRELHYNLLLNQLRNRVILLRNAVGDQIKWIQMAERDPINEGGTPIGQGGDKALMVTLDSLHLSNLSFIKMDVESSELHVLQGAIDTLTRNKPVIVFEILGGTDLDHCSIELTGIYQQILTLLEDLGYQVERIFGNDFLATPKYSTSN